MAKLVTMFSVSVLLAAFACGGGSKKETTTTTTNGSGGGNGGEETTKPDPVEISEDSLTEIDAMLKRKRDSITKCFAVAMQAKEVTMKDKGIVVVHWVIGTNGKANSVRIGQAAIKSDALYECMKMRIKRWSFPTLPRELKYSYGFGFAGF